MKNLLNEKEITFLINAISVNIVYKKLIDLNVFEKYIIKILQKASENNIKITLNEKGIKKISDILKIDTKIISDNINLLAEAGHINLNGNFIVLNNSENLKNFKKEKFENESLEIIVNDTLLEEFNRYEEKEKFNFIQNRVEKRNDIIFYSYDSLKTIKKEIILNGKIYLNNENEISFEFEKDNKLFELKETNRNQKTKE